MNKISSRKFLCVFFAFFIGLLAIVILFNVAIDPFFNYRIPKDTRGYLYDQTYAPVWKAGNSKHLEGYNAIWVGSSLSSHMNEEYLNEKMGINCCTGIISAGRPNVYRIFIENALKNNDLEYVFYELNIQHWGWEIIMGTHYDTQIIPDYIMTDSVLDDAPYLLGQTTLIQSIKTFANKIPFMFKDEKDESGNSSKPSNKQNNIMPDDTVYSTRVMAPRVYSNNFMGYNEEMFKIFAQNSMENIDENIVPLIEGNPDVQFIFVNPPTSCILYSNLLESGFLDEHLANLKMVYQKLLSYDNVQIYNIDADRNYTMNLDNYMDDGHYNPNGGTLMVDCIASGTYRITTDNIEETLSAYEEMAALFKWPFIKKNFSGELVKTLHQQLTALGYPVNSGDIFGEITEQSIKDIQAQHGIDVSGIVFDDTQAIIDQMLNAK